ncbi:hypothetical protein V2S66_26710 [Streptomyces sp. V4-01]|uniref:Uncharacterized protein n=1 Tax=Actinacidiphila polyblastidii TaxID=3110430 RepID=A0ABU7PIG5_9ACTN|nr:hypothetical protein [Streptomyces sp. V4-01]
MRELLILLRFDSYVVALGATIAAATIITSHREEAAAGLAEGAERVAAWRAAARVAAVSALLWLLSRVVLRAHGRHRARANA